MSTIEQATGDALPAPGANENLTGDKARAERVAADRRRRRQWQIIGIRMVSLAIVLSIWQVFGANIDPVLFTTPSKIFLAAVGSFASEGLRWVAFLNIPAFGAAVFGGIRLLSGLEEGASFRLKLARVDSETRPRHGPPAAGTRYFAASLDPGRVTPGRLLGLIRGHWEVENSLHYEKDRWWDDRTTTDVVESRDEVLRRSMISARLELTTKLGKDPKRWEWGRLHRLRLEQIPLGDPSVFGPIRNPEVAYIEIPGSRFARPGMTSLKKVD